MVGFISGNQLTKHKCLVIPTSTEKQLSASIACAPYLHVGIFFDKLRVLASSGSLQAGRSCRSSAVHHSRKLQSSLMPLQILKSVNHELFFIAKPRLFFSSTYGMTCLCRTNVFNGVGSRSKRAEGEKETRLYLSNIRLRCPAAKHVLCFARFGRCCLFELVIFVNV